MAKPKAMKAAKAVPARPKGSRALYTFEVRLIAGPVTELFVAENPIVSRTIRIAGHQTLEDLHFAIYRAFDREEEHLYEFQIGGRKPHDRKARSYGHPMSAQAHYDEPGSAGSVRGVRIDSLGFKSRNVFYYWFDFGDDWWHHIKVVGIENAPPEGRLPQIITRVGESPPQYPDFDWDDEEELEGEDEEED
jgi:hypothetical protein